ncbi:tetratricopeptide repeat protein [Nibribacter ruber]|uniref:Tetratricopeptide repeat protein n=1 Tax=Nibribacter ruber TaxID=2698458 RepID=A0A6P1NVM5_9BACT|nr:tetratricopeptide repeat protein [Nibribacter ruber]QHL87767.1 tetratricopeptide repeat protein [Nibribacter ruber]
MSKGRVALVISAIVLVVVLALLPKVIINKDKKGTFAADGTAAPVAQEHDPNHPGHEDHAEEAAAPMPGNPAEAHAAATPAQLKEIAELRTKFNRESNSQAKAQTATQLGEKFANISKYDSAGYFFEQAALARPGEKSYQKAADQYFEAFTFAATQDRSQTMGQKARELYEKVLKNNPANLDAKTNTAMTYIASDNPMKGVTLLREVIATDPKNEKALFNLGVLSMQSNQYDKAVERFRELVMVNPSHVDGNFYLGVSLAETKQKGEAQKAFARVKELSKDPEVLASVDSYLQKMNNAQ